MHVLHKIREKLQEESHQQQADMHAIHSRIGSDHDIIITQSLVSFFNIQRMLQQVELFIFIYYFFGKAKTVQWLATQAEYSLCIHTPRLGDRTTGTIPFGNKNGALLLFLYNSIFILAGRFIIVM